MRQKLTYLLALVCMNSALVMALPQDGPVSGYFEFPSRTPTTPIETDNKQAHQVSDITKQKAQKHMNLVLSLLWEGDQIKPINTEAIESLRTEFPTISLVQFLNPAYFVKQNADKAEIAQMIQKHLRPEDTIGLHLHGWKRLMEASNVDFRKIPTFWDNDLTEKDCEFDCGHEVPISSYSDQELDKIYETSIDLLIAQGLPKPTVFAAGGWMDTPQVIAAAKKHGINYDLSGVPANLEEQALKSFPLFAWLQKLWVDLTPNTSRAITVSTSYGPVTQIYNNAGTIDYRSSSDILENFKTVSEDFLASEEGEFYFHLGFYHESAADHITRLKMAVKEILNYAESKKIPLVMFAPKKP